MIDLKEVEQYNRILAYSKNRYMPYDEKEKQAMRESAPLIKFTLGKSIRALEDKHISEILNYSKLLQATHVVVTCNHIQFFVDQSSVTQLNGWYSSRVQLDSVLMSGKSNHNYVSSDKNLKLLSIEVARWERFSAILPHDTKKDGLYSLDFNNTYKLVRNKKELARIYDQLGYVTKPGIPPIVVSPDEMSKAELSKVLDVINFCGTVGVRSKWSKALVKPLRQCITMYRSQEIMKHEKLIKQIINLSR